MRILDRSIYVGPSHFARFPVIRLELDLGELENWPTGKLGKDFVDGLIAALPGLAEHGCSYQEAGGFIRRMNEDGGTWLGHVLEQDLIPRRTAGAAIVSFAAVGARSRRARSRGGEDRAVLVAAALASDAVHVEAVQGDGVGAKLRRIEGRDDVAGPVSRLRGRVAGAASGRNELIPNRADGPMHHQKARRGTQALRGGLARVARLREDKAPAQATTLDEPRALYERQFHAKGRAAGDAGPVV